MMSLVHIAGYVTRKDVPTEEELFNTTTFYFKKYGDYTKSMDRVFLNVPTDKACQWTVFCYLLFNAVKDKVCRKSLANLFVLVADMHNFGMDRVHANILSNILFKNYCAESTPRSTKEAKLKVIKLSNES